MQPAYHHTQRAPLCLLLYALPVTFLIIAWVWRNEPVIAWVFPATGIFTLLLAASFHHLTVTDAEDSLLVSFGPLPIFRRSVNYADIVSVEVGKTTLLDGWGIHISLRGGWVWNLWGWDCVAVQFKSGNVLRIGTDDAEKLASFVRNRITEKDHE